ncbi:hypothetical protein MDAP_000420 [Mitosporidium daphniae]
MNTSNTWFKKLASDDTIDFLPTILIVILVSCILFCILWMIISLVRKRSHVQQLNTHREAAVAAFFDTENLRVLDSVYTSSGDPLGKLSSYQPVLYFIKIEPFDLNRKICKPISVEVLANHKDQTWVHMIARMPCHSYDGNQSNLEKQHAMHGPTSRLKFASLICKSNAPTILQ